MTHQHFFFLLYRVCLVFAENKFIYKQKQFCNFWFIIYLFSHIFVPFSLLSMIRDIHVFISYYRCVSKCSKYMYCPCTVVSSLCKNHRFCMFMNIDNILTDRSLLTRRSSSLLCWIWDQIFIAFITTYLMIYGYWAHAKILPILLW